VHTGEDGGRLWCPFSALLFAPFCFARAWNFPPASQALILKKKLIEQKAAFHFHSLLLSGMGGEVIPSEGHPGPTSALPKLSYC
jgi:hypothetical protein